MLKSIILKLNEKQDFINLEKKLSEALNDINFLVNKVAVLEQEKKVLENEVYMIKGCILDMHREVEVSADNGQEPKLLEKCLTLDEAYELVKNKIPYAFSQYEKLMENNKEAYVGLPLDSCVIKGHVQGEYFKRFLKRYLKGYVLDIGCGPQELPLYLEGYDAKKICGLDPLEPEKSHPFTFQQGIAEYIPWEDNSFDCVIFCTSFDHVFLIEQVLEEVKRVCKPNAYVVFWTGFDERAPKYEPYSEKFEPYDDYHMFHYSKENFEKDMLKYFEKIEYFQSGVNTHFYAYMVKKDFGCKDIK